MAKVNFGPSKLTLPVPDPHNIGGMTAAEYLALRECNPESHACVPEVGIVVATAVDGGTNKSQGDFVIPP